MTWEEIRKQYAGEWVLIEYRQLDQQLNVVEGDVIAHSPRKEEIYKHLLQTNFLGEEYRHRVRWKVRPRSDGNVWRIIRYTLERVGRLLLWEGPEDIGGKHGS